MSVTWVTRQEDVGGQTVVSADHGPGEPADAVLARQARLGDRDAFALIVSRHGPALYRYAYRLLDHPDGIEDVVQEAFLDAWRGLPQFRGDAALRTWLFTLTRHRVQRHNTRQRTAAVDVDDLADRIADPAPAPDSQHLHHTLLDALDAALRRLPARQRSAWLLREVEQLSYDEIATILNATPAVVRGLLERARANLATTLKEWR
jgi:RNA polymerase sigma-70 factor, ECF subfamily